MKDGAVQKIYMVVAGAIALGSLTFSIGTTVGQARNEGLSDSVANLVSSGERREARIQTLEKLCERWDERWTNLQGWMAKIDARLELAARIKE